MLRLLRNKKAQNTAEYAVLIGIVVAAAVAMQTYVKRGLQGKIKAAVDHSATAMGGNVGNVSLDFNARSEYRQYEPEYLSSTFTTTKDTGVQETTVEGQAVTPAE